MVKEDRPVAPPTVHGTLEGLTQLISHAWTVQLCSGLYHMYFLSLVVVTEKVNKEMLNKEKGKKWCVLWKHGFKKLVTHL